MLIGVADTSLVDAFLRTQLPTCAIISTQADGKLRFAWKHPYGANAIMHRAAFINLAIWTTFAQAFYPYIPIYACDEYHGCQDEDKRSLPAGEPQQAAPRDADVGDLLTLKLTQRSSPVRPMASQLPEHN